MESTDPAPRDQVRAVLLKVAYLMEPDMSEARLRALIQYVADQDWTQAELFHAAERLPRDEHLDQKIRYGGRLTPADFDRIIEGTKKIADQIDKPLTRQQMIEAVDLEPALSRSDFRRESRPQHDEDRWILKAEPLRELFGMDRTRADASTPTS